jgi:hypothetical protein
MKIKAFTIDVGVVEMTGTELDALIAAGAGIPENSIQINQENLNEQNIVFTAYVHIPIANREKCVNVLRLLGVIE